MIQVAQGEQEDLVEIHRAHQRYPAHHVIGLALQGYEVLGFFRPRVVRPAPFGAPQGFYTAGAQGLVERGGLGDKVQVRRVVAFGQLGVGVIGNHRVQAGHTQCAEGGEHGLAVGHFAEERHAGSHHGFVGIHSAQCSSGGGQQAGVACRVSCRAPKPEQVGLIPDLPGIHAGVALREQCHAVGEDVRVLGRILVLIRRAGRCGGDEGRRAHQVEHRFELIVLQLAHQLIKGCDLILACGGFQLIPMQIQAYPLQAQGLEAVDLQLIQRGAEPQELRVHAQEVLPHHHFVALEYMVLGVSLAPPHEGRQAERGNHRKGGEISPFTHHKGLLQSPARRVA